MNDAIEKEQWVSILDQLPPMETRVLFYCDIDGHFTEVELGQFTGSWTGSGDENCKVIVRKIEPQPLVIEAGKYYRLRNRDVVGPIVRTTERYLGSLNDVWRCNGLSWNENGNYWNNMISPMDIVAEVPNPEPPKPKYIPWTYETCPIGVVVEKKGEKMKAMIHAVFANGATVHGSVKYFSVLLDEWEQLDGSPCGVKVSE